MISGVYSRGNLEEKEDPRLWSLSSMFVSKFEELVKPCGGINCRDIAGVDWKNKEAVKEYYSNPESSRKRCTRLVGDAAFILGELLEQDQDRSR